MTATLQRPAVVEPPASDRPWSQPAAVAIVLVLLGQALVLADVQVAVLRPLLGGVLLAGLPALALARTVFARLEPLLAGLYALGVVTLGLIVVPLLLNTVLPWVGVDAPLARPVLVAVSTIVDVGIFYLPRRPALVTADELRRMGRGVLRARFEPAVTVAALAVVAAVAGAVRLNNELGGTVAVLAHVLAVGALGLAVLLRRRSTPARDAAVVYLTGLALLLGTSLRGWFITGHDIQNEYLAFLYTHDAGHWVMSTYPQPYNACLSVNILPSVLVEYLGVTGVFVFKVLLQLVFAAVPVCVYVAARRIVAPQVAMLAGAVFMIFPTFYTDMPFLVRQEVAYLFLAQALLAAAQPSWPVRGRRVATAAFGAGVILSHYSTTYLLVITLLLGAIGTAAGRSRLRRRGKRVAAGKPVRKPDRPERTVDRAVLLAPLVVLGIALAAWTWSSPLTHSGGHLAETVDSLTSAIVDGNAAAGSSDLKYSIIAGGGPTDRQRLDKYLYDAGKERLRVQREKPGSYALTDLTRGQVRPPVVERDYLPLTAAGRAVAATGVDVRGVNSLLRTGAAVVIQLLLVVGLVAMMRNARITRRLTREQFWLVLASIGALGAIVVVPGLSANYGVLRAFQQTLLFAAPLVAIGLVLVVGRLRRWATPAAAAVVTVLGLVLTGAQPALLGGYYAQLNQSNSGQYYDLLYTRSPQLATATWLARDVRGRGLVSVAAADIVPVTRLQMFLPRNAAVSGNFAPLQLTRDTYVVMGPQTVNREQATVFYTGNLLTYRYPVDAVAKQLDLIYSTSGNRIYR